MLLNLHVRNLALIEEQEVTFGEGLNILTGETGAGKSVVIGGISLAIGARADATMIRTGADYALVELTVQVEDERTRRFITEEMELPLEEDGTLLIQRRIGEKRSGCRIGGEGVTLAQLRELASHLIDIHGQNDNQQLLHPARQARILDDFAGKEVLQCREEQAAHWQRIQSLQEELEALTLDDRERARALDLASYELAEIEEAALRPGEDEQLETDYRRMVNGQKLSEAVAKSREALEGADGGVQEAVGRSLRELNSVTSYDEGVQGLVDELAEIEDLISGLVHDLSAYEDTLSCDGESFAQTEARLNLVNRLKDKYGGSIEAVLRYRTEREAEIERLSHIEETRQALADELAGEQAAAATCCGKLTKLRGKAAASLAEQLIQALQDLNFLDVRLEIRVTPQEERMGATGWDAIEFMISTNPGETLRPLNLVASGGELSRIMLAFKSVISERDETPTLIFDEIDAGISGQTAWRVSQKLGQLSDRHQIICITHLPQIAAQASTHFLIEKGTENGRTVTRLQELSPEDSDRELARMLGGAGLTEEALANARQMRREAREGQK